MNQLIDILSKRVSFSKLQAPAPDETQIKQVLLASARVPDHLQLRPWRFLSVRGEARIRLGEVFAEAEKQSNSPATPEHLDKLKAKTLRAPLIIVGICAYQPNDKVPEIEQLLSTACVMHNIGLALFSLGFGSIWRTGNMAYDPFVKQALGVKDQESIVGYLYVGTPAAQAKTPEELIVEDYLQAWNKK